MWHVNRKVEKSKAGLRAQISYQVAKRLLVFQPKNTEALEIRKDRTKWVKGTPLTLCLRHFGFFAFRGLAVSVKNNRGELCTQV